LAAAEEDTGVERKTPSDSYSSKAVDRAGAYRLRPWAVLLEAFGANPARWFGG